MADEATAVARKICVDELEFNVSQTLSGASIQPLFSDAWTGSLVWPASVVLSKYLMYCNPTVETTVLEVGSGCGLCGLVAAALGHNVTLTDQPDLVDLLKENVQRNRDLYDLKSIKVLPHEWGCFDNTDMSESYDMILVSDCINPLYGVESWRALAETLKHFSNERTKILLSYEERGNGEAWDDFTKIITTTFDFWSRSCRTDRVFLYEFRMKVF